MKYSCKVVLYVLIPSLIFAHQVTCSTSSYSNEEQLPFFLNELFSNGQSTTASTTRNNSNEDLWERSDLQSRFYEGSQNFYPEDSKVSTTPPSVAIAPPLPSPSHQANPPHQLSTLQSAPVQPIVQKKPNFDENNFYPAEFIWPKNFSEFYSIIPCRGRRLLKPFPLLSTPQLSNIKPQQLQQQQLGSSFIVTTPEPGRIYNLNSVESDAIKHGQSELTTINELLPTATVTVSVALQTASSISSHTYHHTHYHHHHHHSHASNSTFSLPRPVQNLTLSTTLTTTVYITNNVSCTYYFPRNTTITSNKTIEKTLIYFSNTTISVPTTVSLSSTFILVTPSFIPVATPSVVYSYISSVVTQVISATPTLLSAAPMNALNFQNYNSPLYLVKPPSSMQPFGFPSLLQLPSLQQAQPQPFFVQLNQPSSPPGTFQPYYPQYQALSPSLPNDNLQPGPLFQPHYVFSVYNPTLSAPTFPY